MCPDPRNLSAYFDGEVSAEDRRLIDDHLASCPACRATLELFGKQRDLLHSIKPGAGEDAAERIDKFWRYVGQNRIQRVSSPRRLSVPIPVAAAAILALALAVTMNFVRPRDPAMPDVLVVEAPSRAPTVVSLTITPGELEEFFALLEGSGSHASDGMVVLPAELPVPLYGEPQMVRPASLEGGD